MALEDAPRFTPHMSHTISSEASQKMKRTRSCLIAREPGDPGAAWGCDASESKTFASRKRQLRRVGSTSYPKHGDQKCQEGLAETCLQLLLAASRPSRFLLFDVARPSTRTFTGLPTSSSLLAAQSAKNERFPLIASVYWACSESKKPEA